MAAMPAAGSLSTAVDETPLHGSRQETLDGLSAKRDRKQKKEKKDKKGKKDKKEKKKKQDESKEKKRILRSPSSAGDEAPLQPAGSAASSVAKQPRRDAPALLATKSSSAAAEASSAGQPSPGASLPSAVAGLATEATQRTVKPRVATVAPASAGGVEAAPASAPSSGGDRRSVFPHLKSLGRHSVAQVQRDLWKLMHDSETELELAGPVRKKQRVEEMPELAEEGAEELGQQEQGRGAELGLEEVEAAPPQGEHAAAPSQAESTGGAAAAQEVTGAPLRESPAAPQERVVAATTVEEDGPARAVEAAAAVEATEAVEDAEVPLPPGGEAASSPRADEEAEPPFVRDASVASSFPDTLPDDDARVADTQLDAEDIDAPPAGGAATDAAAAEDEGARAETQVPAELLPDVSAALREQPPDEEAPEEKGEQVLEDESESEGGDGDEEPALAPAQPVADPPPDASAVQPAGAGTAEEAAAQVAVHQAFHKVLILGEQAAAGQCATLEAAFSACTTAEAQIQKFHQATKDFQLQQAQELATAMMDEDRCRRAQLEAETALADKERLRVEAVAAERASWADMREAHTREVEEFLAAKRAEMQELERQRKTRREAAEALWEAEKGAALAKVKAAVGATQQARAAIQKALVFSSQNKERWETPPPSVAGVTALIAEAAGGHAADEALAVAQERAKELRRLGQAAFRT